MKTFRFIYLAIFAILLSACQAEIWEPVGDNIKNNSKSAIISLSADELVHIDPITRAYDVDQILSKIEDLNIRLTMKEGPSKFIYCSKDLFKIFGKTVKRTDPSNYISGHSLSDFTLTNDIQIHLEELKSNEVTKVEAIANAKNELPTDSDWSSLQESDLFDPKNEVCMMYGVTDISTPNTHDGKNCDIFNVQLKRSRAMVSVKLIDAGLYEGVKITPNNIRLVNIPTSCKILNLNPNLGNKITVKEESTFEERVLSLGALEGHSSFAHWAPVPEAQQQSLGKHDEDMSSKEMQYLFFPFENMQGTNNQPNNGTSHATKYPDGITDVTDAKTEAKNYKATYIEILCDYQYRENAGVKVGGQIIYRFYLGSNEYNNFDVEGNHYYRVNLNLKKFGGASEDGKTDSAGNLIVNKEDVSWRVDMNTQDWGFEKNQFDFDSHHLHAKAHVVGKNWKFTKVKTNGTSSWLTINIVKKDGVEWANPTEITETHYELNVVNDELAFDLQPMFYEKDAHLDSKGWFGGGETWQHKLDPGGRFDEYSYLQYPNFREMEITVADKTDPSKTQVITIRQYVPIPVTINGETFYMERFEEYTLKDSHGNIVSGFPWQYQDDSLNNLKDENDSPVTYNWGNPSKNQVGFNSIYLSHDKKSAANYCYEKGKAGFEGADVAYYALPSSTMMDAMIKKSAQYDPKWGPFEPISPYNDYWTSSVDKNTSTQSYMYDGSTFTFKSVSDRSTKRRVRAIYTAQ